MKSMSATFQFEGCSHLAQSVGEIPVTLQTDGHYVWIVERPDMRLGTPVLTPGGWFALYQKAVELLDRANDTWARLGAEE